MVETVSKEKDAMEWSGAMEEMVKGGAPFGSVPSIPFQPISISWGSYFVRTLSVH